jgi:uncharacterized membrane protein YfcA
VSGETPSWLGFPLALLAASLTSSAGVGGALLYVPLFAFVFSLPAQSAIATALVTQLVGMATGSLVYVRLRLVDWGLVGSLGMVAVPAAVLGSLLGNQLSAVSLKILYGAAIATLALLLLRFPAAKSPSFLRSTRITTGPWRALTDREGRDYQYPDPRTPLCYTVAFWAAFGSGLIAVGGGTISIPVLLMRYQTPLRIAVATAVVVTTVGTLTGAVAHSVAGQPVWPLIVYTGPGAFVGAQIGAWLNARIAQAFWQRAIALLYLGIACLLLAATFGGLR